MDGGVRWITAFVAAFSIALGSILFFCPFALVQEWADVLAVSCLLFAALCFGLAVGYHVGHAAGRRKP